MDPKNDLIKNFDNEKEPFLYKCTFEKKNKKRKENN